MILTASVLVMKYVRYSTHPTHSHHSIAITQDCQCQSPLPPGCECDPDSGDPDYLCPADLRCVGCRCQDCPESGGQGLGQGREGRVKNPPLVFVIDTTKSVKPDKDSIFNLTSKVTTRIMKDRINIPR